MTVKQVITAFVLSGLTKLTPALPIQPNFIPMASYSSASITIANARLKQTPPYKTINSTTDALTEKWVIVDADIAQLKFAESNNKYSQNGLFIGNSNPDAIFIFNWSGQVHYAVNTPTATATKMLPDDWVVNYALTSIPEPTSLLLIMVATMVSMLRLRYRFLASY